MGWEFSAKAATIFTLGSDFGVGRIDDAERRLFARDENKRGADIVGEGEAGLQRAPQIELFERGFGVFADRHGGRIAGRDAAGAERRQRSASLVEGERSSAARIFGATTTRRVAEQIDARLRLNEVPLGEIIHRGDVRRNENIGRRARLDLLGERSATRRSSI